MFGLFLCLYLKMNKLLNNKYIKILCFNPFKTYKKIKRVFKPLSSHIYIREYYKLPLMYYPERGKILTLYSFDVMWKDKWDSPRFEESPYIIFGLFKWCLAVIFLPKIFNARSEQDDYWEQALWYLYYYNTYSQGLLDKPDINKAKESWPWERINTNESTWNDKFLIK